MPNDFVALQDTAADLVLLDELTAALTAVPGATVVNWWALPFQARLRSDLARTAALIYHLQLATAQYTAVEPAAATDWQQAYQQTLDQAASTAGVTAAARQARQAAKDAARLELTNPVLPKPVPTGPSRTEVRQAGQTAYDAALEPLRQEVLPNALVRQRIAYLTTIGQAVNPESDEAGAVDNVWREFKVEWNRLTAALAGPDSGLDRASLQ